jgi:predicted RNA-binding protein with PIN domain
MPRLFLIDGYNLAFAWPPVRRQMLIDKQQGREKLLELLARFKKKTGAAMTVVFDGRDGICQEKTGTVLGLKVIYAQKPISADEEIYRLVSAAKDKSSLTVVSSDRQVAGFARRHGVQAIGSGQFAGQAEMAMARAGGKPEKPEKFDAEEWAEYFGLNKG